MRSHALRTSSVVSAKTASSTFFPPSARPLTCSLYASPCDRAAAKIVGLVVTPTTCLWSMRSWSRPLVISGRFRSSSQIETPCSDRAFSASVMSVPSCSLDGVLRGGDDGFCRDAELAVDRLVVGRGAEVVDADDAPGVADVVAPAERHRGLDADPRTHRGREHLVAVG